MTIKQCVKFEVPLGVIEIENYYETITINTDKLKYMSQMKSSRPMLIANFLRDCADHLEFAKESK